MKPPQASSPRREGTVLVVEDEAGLRDGLLAAMESVGLRAIGAAGLKEARALLDEPIDCILLDIRLKDGDGLDLLEERRSTKARDVPIVVVTAYGDGERTIRAMRDGAFDYLTKPFELPELLSTVERAVAQRQLVKSLVPTAAVVPEKSGLVGTSAAMLAIWKLIGRAAASPLPVLITGETGVGKELVAKAIHDYSARSNGPFVAVNLAALPPNLIESELFGHERGAFTGAVGRRNGRFELAAGGTLFLDEIGDLDASLQTKLLRVLQEGRFERVGGSEAIATDARIVAATNKPVRPNEVDSAIREDLYYRLAVIEIEVPPLWARKSDIPLLVAHALSGTPSRAVSEAAMDCLLAYRWPGNVRELLHVVERASVLSGGEVIDVDALPALLTEGPKPSEPAGAAYGDLSARGVTLREAVSDLERRAIAFALERAKGNRSEAARQLGIGRPQLYAKMEEYGIGGRGEEDAVPSTKKGSV